MESIGSKMTLLRDILLKWAGPAGISVIYACIVGGTIWAVQLNFAISQLISTQAEAKVERQELYKSYKDLLSNTSRLTYLVQSVDENTDELKKSVIDHNKEAEVWKRRIIVNENSIEALHE